MNKYMIRGLALTALGILIGLLGSQLQAEEYNIYKWILTIAVLVFGVGFLTIVYSLIRKIERKSIIEDREEQQEKAFNREHGQASNQEPLNKDQEPNENS